jgi:hypothetical protein
MPEYRAYIVGQDGHFYSSKSLDCPDDVGASEAAKQLVDGHDVELWQRDRMVAKSSTGPKTTSSPVRRFPLFGERPWSRNPNVIDRS